MRSRAYSTTPKPVDVVLIPLQLVFAMYGMGAVLKPSDFSDVGKKPHALGLGLALQWLGVPALAVAFIWAFELAPGWAVGLLLVASVPGGASSNLFTFLARGDLPLSIASTVITTLGCVVFAPMMLGALAVEHLSADFSFPTRAILSDVGLYLILPLAAGLVTRRAAPAHAPFLSRWSIRGSILCLAGITLDALGTGKIKLFDYGWEPPLVIFLFAAVLAYVTPHLVSLLGFDDKTATALTIEVGVRNVAIALLLMRFFFPEQEEQGHALYSCLLYSGVAFPLSILTIWRGRKGLSPAFLRPAVRTAEQ